MDRTIGTPHIAYYWNMLKHLSDNAKMDLIVMLTQSLKRPQKTKKISAKDFYGIWGDDGLTADEFNKELKEARKFNQEIVEL